MKKLINSTSSLWNYYFDFLNISNGLNGFFNTVIIETTTYCNRRCSYCPNVNFDRGSRKNEITLNPNLYYKIIDELSELKFSGKLLPHLYGEPLMDKRLPEMLGYAKKKLNDSMIAIHTNGDYLNEELIQKLAKNSVDAIIITEHGDKLRQNLIDLKHKYSNQIKITYRPKTELELMNRGGAVDLSDYKRFKKCMYPSQALTINALGKVVLCCNDYHGDYVFGDLQTETILDIWNKQSFSKIRKQTKKGNFQLDICKKCTS